jgi:tRNA(fMet)-specific endonuclease VapC
VTYLLDTNAAIAWIRDRPVVVRGKMRQATSEGASISISTIALFQLWYGVDRSERRRENTERLRIFLSGAIDVAPFEEGDATVAGELRAALEKAGTPIGPYDLLIAAQAVRSGATLVTANVSEFARVPGLTWQDWSTSS